MTLLTDERAGQLASIDDDIVVVDEPRLRPPHARLVVATVAAGFIVMYVVVALLRLRYPYELEWIEGGMVNHVAQLRGGHHLYGPPSLRFTPDIYTPLYFAVSALVSFVSGTGYFTLRLVSFLSSLALFAAIGCLVHRETGDRAVAVVAVGLFAACYRIGGAWLDLAREDTLCLALLFWGLVVARDARTVRRAIGAGILLSLAFLTKQVALVPAVGVGMYLLAVRRGRSTVAAYAAAVAVGIAGTSLVFDRLSDGWYGFYVWRLPSEHAVATGSYLGFFTHDLLLPLAVALGIAAAGLVALHRRDRSAFWFHVLVGGALAAASYSARLHTGGYDNVLLPAYGEVAVLFGIGVHRVVGVPGRAGVPRRRLLGVLAAIACLVQFGRLVYDPAAQVPSRFDAEIGAETIAAIRALPQPVYLPGHPWYLEQAGLPAGAQSAAIGDVLRAGGPEARAMAGTLWDLVAARHFASIVVESDVGYSYLPDNLCRYYEPARPLLASGEVSYPVTGTFTGPAEVWLPRAVPDDRDCWAIGNWTIGLEGGAR